MKRRTLLKSLAAGAYASPLVSLFGQSAIAQEGDRPIRTLFIYHPNGCWPDHFHPTAGSLVLPEMTAPLESVKQHCVFMDGIGLSGEGSTHEGGAAKVLTGADMGGGQGASGSSIDVLIGKANAANGINTTAPSLQMGLFASTWSDKSISFDGTTRLPYSDDPIQLYNSLFSGLGSGTGSTTEADPAAVANVQILSKARADLSRLQNQLGSIERERLDMHSSALDVLEAKLQALAAGGGGGGGAGCSALDLSGIGAHDWNHVSPSGPLAKVSDAQQDIATLALSCDITRSISFMYSHPVSPITNPVGGQGDHDASHGDAATHTRSKVWWMEQIANFITKLSVTPDGNGSLLDNTIVLLVSELGNGNYHDHWRMPFVLAGGANTGLVTGRSLDFRGTTSEQFGFGQNDTGVNHANLLELIASKAGHNISLPNSTGSVEGIW